MENKRFFLLTVLVSMSLLLASTGPGIVSAQEEQPPSPVPLRSIPPHPPGYNQSLNPGIPEDRAELMGQSKSAAAQPMLDAQGVALGQPGLSFRYVQTFGTTGEPYLADGTHLDKPNGLFIDSSNNLYTVEENGHRLLRFNSSGVNNMIIGHAGQPWAHDDFLAWPRDVAKDPNGNIWVAFNYAALKEFDSAGNPLQVFPENEPWVQGTANDRFNTPWGIAFGPNGYMYISDQGNHRIQVYNISGGTPAYVQTIGQTGVPHSGNNGFNRPGQIAFDSLGRLYVVDSFGGNFRVQRCTKTVSWACQTFFGQTGVEGNDLSHMSWAAGITIRNDVIYIADGANYRILKCTTAGVCTNFAGVSGVGGSDNSHFWYVADVAVDSSGNVFVSDIDNFRIQKFNSAGAYQSTIGVTGVPYLTDSSHINSPWGVAVNTSGDVYTVENLGYRLLKFNAAGSQQWAVGTPGARGNDNAHLGDSPEGNPAVDSSGRVYVADTNNQRVQIFNSNGSYFATIGTGQWGSGNNEFAVPNGIAISPVNGDIYVADMGNQRIQVFNSARVYKATLGTSTVPGSDNQHFNWPRGVAVAPNGTIYVADTDNFRVQKCNFTTGVSYTCS
ncbi:MAG TPA: NHL repeat-containing protein, partial [Anaerolineales bacterium]|nr:NHL repeat-containing protein [Anaerolineales bacterium]